jgi:hypothetical protein
VYSGEYERTVDRQVPLRAATLFEVRTIDVPSPFIARKSDWGVYQNPGDFERMQKTARTRMLGTYLAEAS